MSRLSDRPNATQRVPSGTKKAEALFGSAYLGAAQALSWQLLKDPEEVRTLPKTTPISNVALKYLDATATDVARSSPGHDGGWANVNWDAVPLPDAQLAFLDRHGVNLRTLARLQSHQISQFCALVTNYLEEWHARSHASDGASAKALADLDTIDAWLLKQGLDSRLRAWTEAFVAQLSQVTARANRDIDGAERSLLSQGGAGRVQVIGRRDGSGDPIVINPTFLAMARFSDQPVEGGGWQTCLVLDVKSAVGGYYSHLRFRAAEMLSTYPQVGGRRGPKPIKLDDLVTRLRADISSGKTTFQQLRTAPSKVMAHSYNTSRTTLGRALSLIASEFSDS